MKKLFVLTMSVMLTMMSNAMILSVNGYGEIDEDTEIKVSDYEEDELSGSKLMELRGNILCTSSQLVVEITRSEIGLEDQLCLGQQCTPGDKQLKQTMTFDVNGAMSWYTHYNYVEGKVYTVEYKFIDGEDVVVLTVAYGAQSEGIENVYSSVVREGVYTIFGQQLRADNSTDGLPAGMYIVGGKKQIIK